MSHQSQNNLYGFPQPLTRVFPAPIISQRSPLTTDYMYPVGQLWVNELAGAYYGLVSVAGNSATWLLFEPGSTALNSLSGDTGSAIPSSGNILLAGTTNQIATTATGSTVTFSLTGPYSPATFAFNGVLAGSGAGAIVALTPGGDHSVLQGHSGTYPVFTTTPTLATLNTTQTITAATGVTITNGNLSFGTAGNLIFTTGFAISSAAGANSFGLVSLAAGTVTVSTTAVLTSSVIILTRQTTGTTGANPLGILSVGTIVSGMSFDINAWSVTNATALATTDTSQVFWMIVNHS